MKNQREIYEALLAGETLYDEHSNRVKLDDEGRLIAIKGFVESEIFTYPQQWKIYTKPKWYENIPDGGVLYWNKYGLAESTSMNNSRTHVDVSQLSSHRPLTKQEIQVFMDNILDE